jgi:hypothetical protein
VALVALLDTNITRFLPVSRFPGHRLQMLKSHALFHWGQWSRMNFRERIKYCQFLLTARWKGAFLRWKFASLEGELPVLHDVLDAQIAAAFRYRPERYDGKLTLLRSAHSKFVHKSSATLGWDLLASQVEVVDVTGDHNSMVQPPNVRTLADRLTECLGQAREHHACSLAPERSCSEPPSKVTIGAGF